MADKPAQIKKPEKKDKGLKTADSVNYPTNFELASIGEKGSIPLRKPPKYYADMYVQGIKDDSKKTKTARKRSSISRMEEIEKLQYKNADANTKGKKVKEIGKIAAQNKKNKEDGLKLARKMLKQRAKYSGDKKKQQSAKAIDTGSTFKKGGRAGYSVGGRAMRGVSKILMKK